MRLSRAALFLGAALLPLAAQAQTAAPAPTAAAEPIAFTERTLPNGLRVYAIRDTGTSNVSIQVWYDVGGKDDPKNRTGFAHMFEHLMFKATRNLVPEQLDRLTEDVGGSNNASTNADYTNYFETVPANHLERLLFAEADRMASLVVDPAVFASERDVVKEELRSRVLAQPYGKLLYQYFPAISYGVHPYARSVIGSIEDLDAATIDDIRAFHATYYRPDNAVLVVAGNFDPAQLDTWVDQYFANIKKPARAIPRVTVREPERNVATHQTVYEQNTPLPAVLLSYPLPADNDPDMPALTVLDGILSGGQSSRLYRSLVYRDQLAAEADTMLDTRQSTGSYAMFAILAGGKSAADGEAALRREVAALRDTLVTAAELSEAKNEILTGVLRSRETAEGKAFQLANAIIIDGDPRAADKQLAAIATVTAADVQRVARKYLGDNRSAALIYLPIESKPAGATGDTIAIAATVQDVPLVVPAGVEIVTPAPEGQRILPPAPGTPVAAAIPTPLESKLANGMRLIVVEKPGLPLVTAALVVAGGGARDPHGRAGVNSLTAELLTKGTATRSATEIAQQVESLGGSIGSGADWDGSSVSVSVMSSEIAPALTILADVARNPAFAQAEIDRARTQAIDGITVALKDPAAIASLAAGRVVFGDAPYGHVQSGTPASLKAITRADVTAAYSAWRPDQAALVLVGDITQANATALATKLFGDWKGGELTVSTGPATVLPKPRVVVIDMPGAGQAGVVVARPGIARGDAGYYPAQVANATLGVGFSSRLNQEIRIKRGLAYGARSGIDARRTGGLVTASTQTKNPTAPQVVSLIVAEMKRLGTEAAPAAELDSRKAVLIGGFGRNTETGAGIANVLGDYALKSVPLSELQRFVPSVQGVSPAAVQAAAAKVLDPASASIIVVGDSKLFVEELRKLYPALEVIPASALNLDSPSLK
jgi:zinc protease